MSFLNLFGGGDDSSSHATNTQTNRAKNQGQSGISGAAAQGKGNTVDVTTTDHGAVAGGLTLGIDALKANQNILGGALDFANAQGTAALASAFGFGRDALDAQRETENGAFDLAGEALNIGSEASKNALSKYTDEVNKLVQQTATSNDARVQQISKYAIAAVVIIVAGQMFFGRKK